MATTKRKTVEEIFGIKDGVGKTFNSTFSVPDFSARNFPGSTRRTRKNKPPFGPPMEFNSPFASMNSDMGTGPGVIGAPTGGDAGAGAMGESITKKADNKFRSFVESIKTDDNKETITTIMKGYDIISSL